jgi:ABC-type uncharacterized transport system substrate-binding protein
MWEPTGVGQPYVEGQTVVFQPRWGNGQVSRLQGLATELVAAKVDILVTAGHPAALAAKQATSSIAIVTANGPDPVELGLAESLARPGGNVTGMTSISSELSAKRLGLLKELIPHVSRMAALSDRTARGSALNVRDTEAAARSLGIAVQSVAVRPDPKEYDAAFLAMKRGGAGAVIVVQSSAFLPATHGSVISPSHTACPASADRRSIPRLVDSSVTVRTTQIYSGALPSSWTRSSGARSPATSLSSNPRSSSWSSTSRPRRPSASRSRSPSCCGRTR